MRRTIVAVAVVAIVGVAGALAVGALANEREFDRLIADGDAAVLAERSFQAIEAYSGAIALQSDSMIAHYKRASVYQSQNQFEAALRDFRSAANLDPSSLRAIESVGDVNMILGRSQRAVERYEAFISLDENNARVLYKLGLARYRAGRIKEAMAPIQQALAIDPSMGDGYYVLGLAQRDLNQSAAARKSLEEAARRSPAGQTSAREALAEVYLRDGDYARAINQLEALAALEPANPDRVVAVGLAQARAGREDAAVITLGGGDRSVPRSTAPICSARPCLADGG